MKKIGQVCKISEENSRKYIEYHKNIPSVIRKLIYDCNIRNYRIFYKDGLLFTYYDYIGTDYDADMQKMAQNSDNQKWWDLVVPLMTPFESDGDGVWSDMQLIFEQE